MTLEFSLLNEIRKSFSFPFVIVLRYGYIKRQKPILSPLKKHLRAKDCQSKIPFNFSIPFFLDTELALALQVSALEAREEQRSADAILLNVDSQPTPQTIKYSEDLEPEDQNSDIVIEMQASSATDSDTLLSSSRSDSESKRRVSETVLDMTPKEVLATNTDASPVNPKSQI